MWFNKNLIWDSCDAKLDLISHGKYHTNHNKHFNLKYWNYIRFHRKRTASMMPNFSPTRCKLRWIFTSNQRESSSRGDLHPICKLNRKHELRMMEIKLWLKSRKQHFHIFPKIKSTLCVNSVDSFSLLEKERRKREREMVGKWKMIKNSSPRKKKANLKLPNIWILDLHIIKNHLYFTQKYERIWKFQRSWWSCKLSLCSRAFHFVFLCFVSERRRREEWKLDPSCCDIEKRAYYQHVVSQLFVGGSQREEFTGWRARGWRAKMKIEYYVNFMADFRFISIHLT